MPLFWERSVIEIKPRRVLLWAGEHTDRDPEIFDLTGAAA
jgi:hypothetical protein